MNRLLYKLFTYTIGIFLFIFPSIIIAETNAKDSLQVTDGDTIKVKYFEDIYIYGASKKVEKITESPTAISKLDETEIKIMSRTNQVGNAFEGIAGIDVLLNGTTDFNVNTRGFNSGLNRRILVLQDGRDLAMPLLGAQEWNTLSLSLDEFAKIEFIKGPSSALYGANSFNGVMSLTSYAPKEVLGTKVALTFGDYEVFRGDIRNAGLITNDLSYKITFGRSSSLNMSRSRVDSSQLEYPGVKLERRPISRDERNTHSMYGTMRFDYDLDENMKLILEGGYSDSGNEIFVQPLGRVLVTNTQRPYGRLAFNSQHINFQASYMRRDVRDSMWLLFPYRGPSFPLGSPLWTDDEDIMLDLQYNETFFDNNSLQLVAGVTQQFQIINSHNTTIPLPVEAKFTGVYSQLSYDLNKYISLVVSGRYDKSNIHDDQFSPRAALVLSPFANHKFRISYSSSFQRPNYAEIFRYSPDRGLNPASTKNIQNIDQTVHDSLKSWSNNPNLENVSLNMNNLIGIAVGNRNLKVEKNNGIEFGYNGIITENILFNADFYYNELSDFITSYGPLFNTDIERWTAKLQGDLTQYNDRVTNLVMNKLVGDDKLRLSYYDGKPMLIQSVGNFGNVTQYGVDLSLFYFLNENFNINANYSYYDFKLDVNPNDPQISSNTSPNKANITLQYIEKKNFDVKLSVHYTDTYQWISGATIGQLPSYTYVNLSAGYYINNNFEISTYIFNVLNTDLIQIFGGTYLPRTFNIKATLTI